MQHHPPRDQGFILMIVLFILIIAAVAAFAFMRVQGAGQ
jgi:hypothetical protein